MSADTRIRVVFCYPLVNPYMAACWRELAQQPSIDLFVIGFQSGSTDMVAFTSDIMNGVPSRLLAGNERSDPYLTADLVAEYCPDVLFISGWSEPPFKNLYFDKRLINIPKILMMDNQLRRDFRQLVGSIILKPLLNRVDRVFVTGERSWQFARYLGISESRIYRGVVSVDYRSLSSIYDERIANLSRWPKTFFFAGRYHERKALDVLVDAYVRYRSNHADPWQLITAGMGPMAHILSDVEGVRDLGFVHPGEMRKCWREAGVFVIPSRFDAWPLVIVEAAATGLPVIATESCGSTVENVRHLFNGYLVPTGDATRLANALAWMHDNYERLPTFGARSRQLAAAYGTDIWVDRVVEIIGSLTGCYPLVKA